MNDSDLPKSFSEKIDKAADTAFERYAGSVGSRAIVASIPMIGSGIDVILSTHGQNAVNRRLNQLFEDMRSRMSNLEEETVDKQYVESEEFIDLLLQAFDTVRKTRDQEKIELCSKILTESTVRAKRKRYSPEEYLHLISNLTPLDLRVLREVHEFSSQKDSQRTPEDTRQDWEVWLDSVCAELEIERADLQMVLGRLRSSGLIMDPIAGHRIGGHSPEEIPEYIALSSMNKLMEFLRASG